MGRELLVTQLLSGGGGFLVRSPAASLHPDRLLGPSVPAWQDILGPIVEEARAAVRAAVADVAATLKELPPVLTEAEAAKYLGVHRNTIRVWRETGGLPVCVLPSTRADGRRGIVRYLRADIDKWLAGRRPKQSLTPASRRGRDGDGPRRSQAPRQTAGGGKDADNGTGA